MKNIIIIAAVSMTLSACTTVPPTPKLSAGLVMLPATSGYTLTANRINGRAVESGHYFTVSPGYNKLEVLVIGSMGEESTINEFVKIEYSEFSAANNYRIDLKTIGIIKELQLFDSSGVLLAKSPI